jgi:hypothetical protein
MFPAGIIMVKHHYNVIVGLACNFVGTNNINLLYPVILESIYERKDASSPDIFYKTIRYYTIYFNDYDLPLLDYLMMMEHLLNQNGIYQLYL